MAGTTRKILLGQINHKLLELSEDDLQRVKLLIDEFKSVRNAIAVPDALRNKPPYELLQVTGIDVRVKCPHCGEVSDKAIHTYELGQDLERGLCPRCHKERGIPVPVVVEELRRLIE